MLRKLGIVLIVSIFAAPFVAADHGLNGEIVATLSDGSIATANIAYVTGLGNSQTWSFSWSSSSGATASCNGFGSLEVGFVSMAGCSTSFSTSATGDSHAYPYGSVDAHQISVTFGGVSGTGQQIVCPDSGNPGVACRTVVASL